jgi:hypothetical protein
MHSEVYEGTLDLWWEYSVDVTDPDGHQYSLCGICGNKGVFKHSILTAKNHSIQVEAYCICPNGRITRKVEKGSKYGKRAESIISTLTYK